MSVVVRHRAARRDLVDVFDHYVEAGTIKTARRFLVQADATFQRLAAEVAKLRRQFDAHRQKLGRDMGGQVNGRGSFSQLPMYEGGSW